MSDSRSAAKGRPIGLYLRGGQTSDDIGAAGLLASLPPAGMLLADRGYDLAQNSKPLRPMCGHFHIGLHTGCNRDVLAISPERSNPESGILSAIRRLGVLPILINHLAKCCLRPSNWTMARFRRAERQHAARGHRDLTTAEYLHQPTQRQILEAIEESRPVVVTGLEPNPPCRDWTLDRLVQNYGDSIVRVRSATQRQTMNSPWFPRHIAVSVSAAVRS